MKQSNKFIITAVVLSAALGFIIAQQSESPSVITAEETVKKLNDTTFVVLDVRTPSEHNAERITESLLIPVQELEERIQELNKYKSKKIIVYCRSGNRSGHATRMLQEHGFSALNMNGGILRWKSLQLPVINGASK